MPPFVLTVPAAFSRTVARLLALGRQHLPVAVVDAAGTLAQSWADTLAVGNTSGGTNAVISSGDALQFSGVADWVITNSVGLLGFSTGGTVRILFRPNTIEVLVPELRFATSVAAAMITHAGSGGRPMSAKAQNGTGGLPGGLLTLEGGDTDNGAGGQVVVQGGTGTTAAGRVRIRHDDDEDGIVVEENGAAHAGGQAILVNASGLGFFDGVPSEKPPVVGAKAGNAALASLCSTLATMGLITDNTT